jgi:GNAT superfamily N-acetyltransferase
MSSKLDITYRNAKKDDIPTLSILRIKQLSDEGYSDTVNIYEHLQQYFQSSLDDGSLVCRVGIFDERIIATAAMCFYQLPPTFSNPTGKVAYITNMFTDEEFRRKGLATLLLKQLLAEAKILKFTSVRLHASIHGKSIYEKTGFRESHGFMAMNL